MIRINLIFLSILLAIYSFCESTDVDFHSSNGVSSFEGVPSGIVGGHVNTATGEFLDFERDLHLPSIEPLFLQRVYTSQNHSQINFCRSWYLNHIQLGMFTRKKDKKIEGLILESSGAFLKYTDSINEAKGGFLKQDVIPGLTNFASGEISGQTNLKNNQLHLDLTNKKSIIKTGAGDTRVYKNLKEKNHVISRLENEIRKNLHLIKYEYRPDGHLSKITTYGAKNKSPYSFLEIKRSPNFEANPKIYCRSNDGREVIYSFRNFFSKNDKKTLKELEEVYPDKPQKETNYYLTEVNRTDAPSPIIYTYTLPNGLREFSNLLVSKKTLPENRFVQAEYYISGNNKTIFNTLNLNGEDFRINYVKQIKEPVGNNSDPIITYSFFYDQTKNTKGEVVGSATEAHNALKHKTRYVYDREKRLTHIENYTYPGMKIYRKQRFYWFDNGNLQMITMENGSEEALSVRTFDYDERGNVLCERFYGKITNRKTEPLVINGKVKTIGCDCYEKHSSYSRDGLNLLLKETFPNGKSITYQYVPETNLVSAKFISDKNLIKIREFNYYDENGSLTKKIIDDGVSEDSNNLEGVNERRLIYLTNRKTNPALGYPEVEEEFYLLNGQEIFNKKVLYSYSEKGELSSKKIFDSKGTLLKSEFKEYDSHGNNIKESNSLGETTTRQFDENNNLIFEQELSTDRYKKCAYDFSNRLKEETEFHSDGIRLTSKHGYDFLNNRISTIDAFGNEIKSTYDEFGRVISSQQPSIPNLDGKLTTLTDSFTYDILNNKITYTNSCQETTYTDYNVLGKPTKVTYPDGTKELYFYNLNGILEELVDKNGITTKYIYDFLDRITRKEKVSRDGTTRCISSYQYDSFHLISEVDPEGYHTTYTYDGLGQKASVSKENSLITYEYDCLDRLVKIKEWFGVDEKDFTAKIYVYDSLDRVIEERSEDYLGCILTKKEYGYDHDGNQIRETFYTSQGPSTTIIEYDSHQKPILITDPEGNSISILYNYNAINKYGQRVLEITKVDSLGNSTITTMNTIGKEGQLIKRNKQGQDLYAKELFYDGRGNCNLWLETITSHQEPNRTLLTKFDYNSANNLISLTEAFGNSDQKVTIYKYNQLGQKESILKPNGIEIYYQYDSLGRLSSERSSDLTIDYAYTYDLNDQIVSVLDNLNHTSTLRSYDASGNIIRETQAPGLVFDYIYDRQGRVIQILYPDHSSVHYEYNSQFLTNVKRFSSLGELLFSHSYAYDLAGNIVETNLSHDLGSIVFSYNMLQNTTLISTPYWKESLSYDSVGNITHLVIEDSLGKKEILYEYDDLYQLTAEKSDSEHLYAYDSLNNRLSKDDKRYQINDLNELLNQGEYAYTYDLTGNLIKQQYFESVIDFSYDARDRLIRVSQGDLIVSYGYDSFNRRTFKNIYLPKQSQDTKVYYAYFGQKEIGALNDNFEFIQHRILGNGEEGSEIGAAIAFEIHGRNLVPIHDHNGNVVTILDTEGKPTETYRYTAFGEEEERCGTLLNPWRFSSKRWDEETSFVYFGRRYYSPSVGRWVTPDPQGYEDGSNLYAYVHNSPLTHCDPFGLYSFGQFGRDSWNIAHQTGAGAYNGFMHPYGTWNSNSAGIVGSGQQIYNRDFKSFSERWTNTTLVDKIGWGAGRVGEIVGTGFLFASFGAARAGLWAGESLYFGSRALLHRGVTQSGGTYVGRGSILGSEKVGVATATKVIQKTPRNGIQLNRYDQAVRNLSEKAQDNVRNLRGWSKSKGWQRAPNPYGQPEKWGIYRNGKFEWRVIIKPEASARKGLHPGSNFPRFDARIDKGGNGYINPFTGFRGSEEIGTHIPLERIYY